MTPLTPRQKNRIGIVTDISRHIEYLLLEHDAVTVPQWGTFSIRQTPSRWVQEEELFLPPVRNVSFTTDSRHEAETLFVQSLAAALYITHEQAQAACAEYVESLRQELAANNVVEVGSIGMFVRDSATGADCFVPCQAGVTSPELYGLDSVYQPRLSEKARQTRCDRQTAATHRHSDDKHVTIRIPRSLLHYAAAAAAAIIVFFSFSTPALYTSPEDSSMMAASNLFLPANLLPAVDGASPSSQQSDMTPVSSRSVAQSAQPVSTSDGQQHQSASPTKPTREMAAAQTENQVVEHKTAKADAEPSASQEHEDETDATEAARQTVTQAEYAVVLASAVTAANAEAYVRDLNSRGIKAELRARGSMRRVLVPGFKSSDEANTYARQIRGESSEFDSAWVLRL